MDVRAAGNASEKEEDEIDKPTRWFPNLQRFFAIHIRFDPRGCGKHVQRLRGRTGSWLSDVCHRFVLCDGVLAFSLCNVLEAGNSHQSLTNFD